MAITYDTTTGLRALLGGNLVSDIDTGFLALAQDIAAALGHAMQEGVKDAGSFEVTQASGGASMVLDIASNVGTGAFVQNDSATGTPLVYIPPTGSKSTVTAGAAHATLPRVDAVVVSTAGVVSIVAGTATSGATLDNARDGSHGGAVIPSNALQLADVLIPATDTTLSNNQIRDRRRWARGAFWRTPRSSGDYTRTNAALAEIDSTNLKPRIECVGNPLIITLECDVTDTSATAVSFDLFQDGVALGLLKSVYIAAVGAHMRPALQWTIVPTAGSHQFAPAFSSSVIGTDTVTVFADSTWPLVFTVQELIRQNAANNATTTG